VTVFFNTELKVLSNPIQSNQIKSNQIKSNRLFQTKRSIVIVT